MLPLNSASQDENLTVHRVHPELSLLIAHYKVEDPCSEPFSPASRAANLSPAQRQDHTNSALRRHVKPM